MNGFAFKIISGGKEHVGGSNTLYANVKTERGALQRLAQSILPPGQYNMYVVRDGVWSTKPTVVYKRAKQNPRRVEKKRVPPADILSAVITGPDRAYLVSEISMRLNRRDLTGALSVAYQSAKKMFSDQNIGVLDKAARLIVEEVAEGWTMKKRNPRKAKRRTKVQRQRSTNRGQKRMTRTQKRKFIRANPTRPILRAARRVQRVPSPAPVGKHVCVQLEGRTVMQSKDTPEFRALALRYARTLKRKHSKAEIKVVAY